MSSHHPPQNAPWSDEFQSHLKQLSSPEFVLGTLHPTTPSPHSPSPYAPRLRYCIYRGMFASLPDNSHNPAPRNPSAYTSDLPTFTTDVRMSKVHDLFATSSGGAKADEVAGEAKDEELFHGSGGGGPVEAVWWIQDVGVQWRVRGRAYVIAEDIDWAERQGGKESSGVRTVKSALGERLIVQDESKRAEWSWEKELTGHFGNVSPGMRGTWRNPSPGTATEGKEPDKEHLLGQKVEDLHDPVARANFRVVVIKPDEVERLELSDPAKARRLRYTFRVESVGNGQTDGEKGQWKTEELWP